MMQKKDWIKRSITLGLAALLIGCATSEDVRILDNESLRLSSQTNTLLKEMESIKRDSSAAQRDVQTLRKEMQAFQNDHKKDVSALQRDDNVLKADLLLRIENVQSEIKVLSAGVEEYKDFVKRPSKEADRVKEEIVMRTRMLEEKSKNLDDKNRTMEERNRGLEEKNKALENRLRSLEDRLRGIDGKVDQVTARQVEQEKASNAALAAAAVATAAVREKGKEKEPAVEAKLPSTGVSSTGAGNLYNDAYQSFQRGDLDGSRRKFEAFLKQYPNTELSDNAQFWIGETYFQKKDFETAILEYEKVVTKYPEGEKVSAALFKQALAFSELGDKTNARNLLRRVIERYPHSEQAEMAKKRMESLK